jgi:hypothetical protein
MFGKFLAAQEQFSPNNESERKSSSISEESKTNFTIPHFIKK